MLNLVIVEDEWIIREGLINMIDWQSIGIYVYGQAENGWEALPLLQSGQVDLLLSDIRMPIMDGLQLVTEIKKNNWDISCVLLSGYSDFDYAQKAIRLGVVDYLIKPCSPQDITHTFQSVVSRIQNKRKLVNDLSGLKDQLNKNLTIIKNQTLLQWLRHPKQDTENRKEQMKRLLVRFAPTHVVVIAIHLDRKHIEQLYVTWDNMELIKFAIHNIAQELLERILLQPIEVIIDQEETLVICNGTYELIHEKLISGLTQLQQFLKKNFNISVSIGVSDSKLDIDLLFEAYMEAIETLQYRFYRGTDSLTFYPEINKFPHCDNEHSEDYTLLHLEQSIAKNLRSGLYAEAINDTEKWLEFIQVNYLSIRSKLELQTLSLLTRLMQLSTEHALENSGFENVLIKMTDQINKIETFEELSGFVHKAIQQVVENLNPNKKHRRKIQQAIDLILENYNSPELSLAGVAKQLFISSTYLSTLFKQELGVNFLDYVHQLRIEKAKALLQASDYKIQTIAKEVGYFDEAHFTKTFKKWTGILPSQYRKEMHDHKK